MNHLSNVEIQSGSLDIISCKEKVLRIVIMQCNGLLYHAKLSRVACD